MSATHMRSGSDPEKTICGRYVVTGPRSLHIARDGEWANCEQCRASLHREAKEISQRSKERFEAKLKELGPAFTARHPRLS